MTDPPPRRPDYSQGLPDHHDPTAGIGGARPAQSALTLRLVLATFGLIICTVFGFLVLRLDVPVAFAVILFVLAVIAAVDVVVIVHRKRRGEPG
ncbi:DUF6343 family protein [Modestobacter lapidis]|nr:hypothetical protein [Modestobacter lapidis]